MDQPRVDRRDCLKLMAAGAAALAAGAAERDEPKRVRVLVVNVEPTLPTRDGVSVRALYRWNDPRELAAGYAADLLDCSGGYAQFEIVEWVDYDGWPILKDGFRYSGEDYCADWERRRGHEPSEIDYPKFLTDGEAYPFCAPRSIVERVEAGLIDEVWTFSPPFAANFWEASMAGREPFFINGAVVPLERTTRRFAVMGFNYERGVDCMLEDFCHRTEGTMSRAYGLENIFVPHRPAANHWERFRMYDLIHPGAAGLGSCHFAPSSDRDYDWGNPREVWSTCDDWLENWPNLRGTRRRVTCADWGGGDMRLHHVWWLRHLPKRPGINPDGRQNNWWKYVVDLDRWGG